MKNRMEDPAVKHLHQFRCLGPAACPNVGFERGVYSSQTGIADREYHLEARRALVDRLLT